MRSGTSADGQFQRRSTASARFKERGGVIAAQLIVVRKIIGRANHDMGEANYSRWQLASASKGYESRRAGDMYRFASLSPCRGALAGQVTTTQPQGSLRL